MPITAEKNTRKNGTTKTKHQGKIHPRKEKRIKQKSNQVVEEIKVFTFLINVHVRVLQQTHMHQLLFRMASEAGEERFKTTSESGSRAAFVIW